jgi:hypothetical protein
MNVRYRAELSHAERTELRALLSGGKQAARIDTTTFKPPER